MKPCTLVLFCGCIFNCFKSLTSQIPDVYSGCYKTKGCISPDEKCIKSKTCHLFVSYKSESDFYVFELYADFSGDKGYVALGFSKDFRMGNDLVVECIQNGSATNTTVQQSWNKKHENLRIPGTHCHSTDFHRGLANCSVIVDNGKIYCKFWRYRIIAHSFENIGRVDISGSRFHALIAHGSSLNENPKTSIGPHGPTGFLSSVVPVNFNSMKKVESNKDRLELVYHAYSMIICWVVVVPNSLFVARYLKETLSKYICCDKQIWYPAHIIPMILACISVISAVGAVLWYRSGNDSKWPTIASSIKHAQIGGISVCLLIMQMISGCYSPTIHATRRSYSTIHAIIGFTAYFLSQINLFRSYYQGMPCNVWLVMLGLFAWQIFWNVVMILHFMWLDENLGLSRCRALSPLPIKTVLPEEAPGRRRRCQITIIHGVGLMGFAGLLCSMYTNGTKCECKIDYCRVSL